jgi:hypothetical protein
MHGIRDRRRKPRAIPAGSRKAILLAEKLDSPAREDFESEYLPVRDKVASRASSTEEGKMFEAPLLSGGGVARSAGVVWFSTV